MTLLQTSDLVGGTTRAAFDLEQHRRDRLRRAEARAEALDRERCRLERILALTLQVAVGHDGDPLVLLDVLEDLDVATQEAVA